MAVRTANLAAAGVAETTPVQATATMAAAASVAAGDRNLPAVGSNAQAAAVAAGMKPAQRQWISTTTFRSKLMQVRQTIRFVALTALCMAATPALAEDSPLAPADAVADRVNPTGVTGMYRCAVGDAATVRFSFTGFDDGQHRIEESLGGRDRRTSRYPWQLAAATLYQIGRASCRERV